MLSPHAELSSTSSTSCALTALFCRLWPTDSGSLRSPGSPQSPPYMSEKIGRCTLGDSCVGDMSPPALLGDDGRESGRLRREPGEYRSIPVLEAALDENSGVAFEPPGGSPSSSMKISGTPNCGIAVIRAEWR